MSYFLPYSHSKNKIEVEVYFSGYAAKSDQNNVTGVDTSQFSKQAD